jgi:hypothetical protein
VSLEELDVLGVNRQGRLYWDGIPVQVSGQLSSWQSIGAVLVTVAAVTAAIAEGVSILRAFVEERISGKAPPWSPRESKKAILKIPLTRATSGASMTQEAGFHAARTTGRRSLALGRTPPPCLSGGRGCVHDSANLNLAKRRLCVALGISLGSSEHCCAISVARVRAALTASIPRSNRPLARRTNFGAAKSCSLVIIFMIRPPTAQSGDSNNAHRSRPYHGSRNSGDSERPMGAFNSGLGCPRSSRQSQTRLNTSAGSSP